MFSIVILAVATLAAVQAAPASVLYPVVPGAPHYVVRPYAAAAPVVHLPTSYSHVSHTQYTSHPVPVAPVVPAATVYHAAPLAPLVYHTPAGAVVV